MVTVGMHYDVVPGREADFEAEFERVLQALESAPGHRHTALYREVKAPHRYAILSEWGDRESFAAFLASDRFRAATAWGRSGILQGRPRHQVYGAASEIDPSA